MKTSQISNKEIKLEMKNTDNNSIKYSLEVTKILVVVCVFIFQPLTVICSGKIILYYEFHKI